MEYLLVRASLDASTGSWLRWVAVCLFTHFIVLHSLANFQAALSQNTNFNFQDFGSNLNNLTLLDDAEPYDNSIFLNSVGGDPGAIVWESDIPGKGAVATKRF
jgi:hypothetical protein